MLMNQSCCCNWSLSSTLLFSFFCFFPSPPVPPPLLPSFSSLSHFLLLILLLSFLLLSHICFFFFWIVDAWFKLSRSVRTSYLRNCASFDKEMHMTKLLGSEISASMTPLSSLCRYYWGINNSANTRPFCGIIDESERAEFIIKWALAELLACEAAQK